MNILLVEDDKRLGEALKKGLEEEAFSVTWIKDGFVARDYINNQIWDVFILDVMLPGMTGIQLCEYIRFKKIDTPVLMLSALAETEDKIKALDIGADDYMVKPFHFEELISRIKALKRRYQNQYDAEEEEYECLDLKVNINRNKISRGDKEIHLSAKEFRLLCILLKNKNQVVSRTSILNAVWNTQQDTYTNVIDVYISYLRKKIDEEFEPKLLQTIKGRGYMITDL